MVALAAAFAAVAVIVMVVAYNVIHFWVTYYGGIFKQAGISE